MEIDDTDLGKSHTWPNTGGAVTSIGSGGTICGGGGGNSFTGCISINSPTGVLRSDVVWGNITGNYGSTRDSRIESLLTELKIKKQGNIEVKSVIYFSSEEDRNLFALLADSHDISLEQFELVVK